MKLLFHGVGLGFLASILHLPTSILAAETSEPPAYVEYVPDPNAWTLARHPTLPVLYVGCYVAPDARNLTTFKLNADGSIAKDSKKICDNYFSVNATNSYFNYRILPRPSVLLKPNVLVLACAPDSLGPYFAETNNNECAVVALDDQGQPTKLLKAFRTSYTSKEHLMGARFEPTTGQLHLAYYVYFGWCELGMDGLPVSGTFVPFHCPINQWYWRYIPRWKKFFTMPPGPGLSIFRVALDGRTSEFNQYVATPPGSPFAGNMEVSEVFRKVYVLSPPDGQDLTVLSLTADGQLTSLPRYFRIGPAKLLRFDFKSKKLYAITDEWMKVFALDQNGFPMGQPTLHTLSCGPIHDALVDESTGKVYLACRVPPGAKP